MRIRTVLTTAAIAAASLIPAGTATAAPGPSYDVIDAQAGWLCGGLTDVLPGPDVEFTFLTPPDEGAPVPPNHCINARSKGNTGVILVFPPDERGPAEGISFDPKADDRPCPHDPDSPDGTWWRPMIPGPDGVMGPAPFTVCHHKP